MKEVQYKLLYNDTIVELRFMPIFRKGAWKEQIQPSIDFLKQMIPAGAREYEPNTKLWNIGIEYWPAYKLFLEGQHFRVTLNTSRGVNDPRVEVPKEYAENFYHATTPITTKESAESIAVALTAFLGVDVSTKDVKELKSLYRRKAIELHPDRNPERAGEMSELNRLWTLYTLQDKIQ